MARKKNKPRVLGEIRRLQRGTDLLMRKLPFYRLAREITTRISGRADWRFQLAALECLQHASEAYMVSVFQAANMCAIHSKRITVMPRDFQLIKQIEKLNLNMPQNDEFIDD